MEYDGTGHGVISQFVLVTAESRKSFKDESDCLKTLWPSNRLKIPFMAKPGEIPGEILYSRPQSP